MYIYEAGRTSSWPHSSNLSLVPKGHDRLPYLTNPQSSSLSIDQPFFFGFVGDRGDVSRAGAALLLAVAVVSTSHDVERDGVGPGADAATIGPSSSSIEANMSSEPSPGGAGASTASVVSVDPEMISLIPSRKSFWVTTPGRPIALAVPNGPVSTPGGADWCSLWAAVGDQAPAPRRG